MNTVENTTAMQSHQHPTTNRTAKIKSFGWHLIQMIIAMEIGMALYTLFANQLAPASYRALTINYRLFGYWMMMLAMTVPMIALMRWHKFTWRVCIEMTVAMLAPVVLLTVLNLISVISFPVLHSICEILMNLGMVAYMIVLYRRG